MGMPNSKQPIEDPEDIYCENHSWTLEEMFEKGGLHHSEFKLLGTGSIPKFFHYRTV
jgi:hypothetical protein